MNGIGNKKAFAVNLAYQMNRKNIDRNKLCKDLNFKYSTVSEWLAARKYPRIDKIELLANYFGVLKSDLIEDKAEQTTPNAYKLPTESIRMVPVFESASAGFGVGAVNTVTEFTPIFIQSDYEYENTICVRVCGDSMHPQIQDGDLVQVLKQDTAETGDIVVILDGDDAYVKRFIRTTQGITLESFNPSYPPMKFNRAESNQLRIVGIVKRIIRDI